MVRAGGVNASTAMPPQPSATRTSRNTNPSVGPPITAVTVALVTKVTATAPEASHPGATD